MTTAKIGDTINSVATRMRPAGGCASHLGDFATMSIASGAALVQS